jgi:sugar phosphate isomerase/epimerase
MNLPRLAMCNFIPDVEQLRRTALTNGFDGIDWTLNLEDLSINGVDNEELIRKIARLHPLSVRYHCAFKGVDLGNGDRVKAEDAVEIFRKACQLVSRLDGEFMTIHLGLGRDSYDDMVWDHSVNALGELVCYAAGLGVRVCLENLASGWSSRPELFEKLVRMSGAGVTLDIGHARMSPSVQSQFYSFEDFITPHHDSICSAHIYHEEVNEGHVAPESLDDLRERLELLGSVPCDWWVLELREAGPLMATLGIVREFLRTREASCEEPFLDHWGALLCSASP